MIFIFLLAVQEFPPLMCAMMLLWNHVLMICITIPLFWQKMTSRNQIAPCFSQSSTANALLMLRSFCAIQDFPSVLKMTLVCSFPADHCVKRCRRVVRRSLISLCSLFLTVTSYFLMTALTVAYVKSKSGPPHGQKNSALPCQVSVPIACHLWTPL